MLQELISNKILIVACISWLTAQVLKIIINLFNEKEWDLHLILSSGGMPSGHTAFTVALAVGIGQSEGYNTPLFAMALVFCFIVMYDATNIRLEAGKQAALLNKLIQTLQHPNLTLDAALKELLGHTPLQVAVGALLGIIIAVLLI
jgi:hypothetical protein